MLRKRFYKDKTFMIILLVCLIAVTAIAIGSVVINRSNNNNENLVDLNEDDDIKKPVDSQVKQQETESNTAPTYSDVSSIDIDDGAEASNSATSLHFSSSSILYWPIEGNVILDFNMENTIYFPTLDKYQCNPAILIQGDIDTPVLSAADGVVKEINEDEELGNSIVVSIGDNYEITYGQLKDIKVKEGQAIKAKDVIASVNEPTKYYKIEGTNLYFMLTKDGEPIDPLDYLSY